MPNLTYTMDKTYTFGIPVDKTNQLLFRTTRMLDGKWVWANTQKVYKNSASLRSSLYLKDVQFGVMLQDKSTLYNSSWDVCEQYHGNYPARPREKVTHFIFKGTAISRDMFTSSYKKDPCNFSKFQLNHLRYSKSIQKSFPNLMKLMKQKDTWLKLVNHKDKDAWTSTWADTTKYAVKNLVNYDSSWLIPKNAKAMELNVTIRPTNKRDTNGQSTIRTVFNHVLHGNSVYRLSRSHLRSHDTSGAAA